MTTISKYHTPDLPLLLKRINETSIGMDGYFNRIFDGFDQMTPNYPPYNLISLNDFELRLELALAGFKRKELSVYTQDGKLFIEGQKDDKNTDTNYVHKGLAQRSFKRTWTIAEDTEVASVSFEDGLLCVNLKKVVPDQHKRKDYL